LYTMKLAEALPNMRSLILADHPVVNRRQCG
jgi:hypothetical protein